MNDQVYEATNKLAGIRGDLQEMLEETYRGPNYVLKETGDGSRYRTNIRKTTLKEARARIKRAADGLNKVINAMQEWHDNG